MRLYHSVVVVFALLASSVAFAGDGDAKSGSKASPATPAVQPKDAAPSDSPVASELAEMKSELASQRSLLDQQQERIATLEQELRASRATGAVGSSGDSRIPNAPTVEGLAAGQQELGQKVSAIQTQIDANKKSFEDRLKKFGPFAFSGDFKLRDEPFIGGPADQSQVRNRERFRVRFNVDARLNDDISGGFAFASGDVNNPISTNQTANQQFTRKGFDLDRAFINYTPHQFKSLTLAGGKFAYPWYSTELTWDKDLNPEGLAQKLDFKRDSWHFLKEIAFVGFELPFSETAGVNFNYAKPNASIVQSVVYGGQIQSNWQLLSWLKFGAYTAFYNWHHPDPVALAVALANAGSPDLGLQKLNGNADQNSTFTTTGTFTATGQKVITNAQFASKFALLDTIARFDVKTPAERWPLVFLGDFVQNTRPCENVVAILAKPANTATETFTRTQSVPCNDRERRGYWLEARVGRQEKKGDWNFSYTRIFVEREAVLGVFNYSEMRQGTNVSQHRVEVFYQALPNVQFAFTGLFGRPLVTASSPGPAQNILKRLQFDVNYKF
jgi:Putative porin